MQPLLQKITIGLYLFLLPVWVLAQSKDTVSVLQKYYSTAIDSNPTIRAAYNKYEMALQRVPQAKSLPDPTISAGYGVSPIETRLGAREAKISVKQMFPWFGTLKAEGKEAALEAKARFENFRAKRNLVLYKLKRYWYKLYENQKKIQYNKQEIRLLKTLENIAVTNFENQQSGMVDVLDIQMNREELTTQNEWLRDKKETLRTKFNELLNRNRTKKVTIPDSLMIPGKDEFAYDSILDNPLIDKIEYLHQAANKGIKAAKLRSYPQLGVGIDYGIISERNTSIPNNGRDMLMPMVSLKVPLHYKKHKARIRENELNQQFTRNKKEEQTNTLETDFKQAKENYTDAYRKTRLYQNLLTKAEKSLDLLMSEYSTNGKDYEDVLRMEQKVLRYKINIVKNTARIYISRSKLRYLEGGY